MNRSRIVLGLWPIAGVTTVGVTRDEARRTIAAAIDNGITTFDTAYSYGYDGESDLLLGEFLRQDRERLTVMGKVGQRWDLQRRRIVDGSPSQLIADAEESLRRLGIQQFDVLFLHAPDPNVPLDRSASAMSSLRDRGLCRQIGICNVTPQQLDGFAAAVQTDAIQCPLNMIQRDSLETLIQPAENSGRDVYVFWTLMKGLLAGKIGREHVFQPGDSRPNYPIFQGQLRASIHDALDEIALLGEQHGMTVAQIAIGWTLSQPGVTAALVGARRPEQILETISAKRLEPELIAAIEATLSRCLGEELR